MDPMEGLGDAARLARGCAVMGHAVTLARWIGTGRRPVTAAGAVNGKSFTATWDRSGNILPITG